jgi:heme exporter protein C
VPVLHALANPARFLGIARPLTPLLFWAGVALIVLGCRAGLTQTPPDYLEGGTVRVLYIHVPAARLSVGGRTGVALARADEYGAGNGAGRGAAAPGDPRMNQWRSVIAAYALTLGGATMLAPASWAAMRGSER